MSEFLAQGGYGFYVWSCYGLAALLIAGELLALRGRRRTILTQMGRLMRMRKSEVEHEGEA